MGKDYKIDMKPDELLSASFAESVVSISSEISHMSERPILPAKLSVSLESQKNIPPRDPESLPEYPTITALPRCRTIPAGNVLLPISWDGAHDPTNPQNWKTSTKWIVTVVISAFSFTTMMTSTIVAPSIPHIARDLHISSEVEAQLILSTYVLAYAFGPFLWGPMSEIYGRTIILQIASTWFLTWNVICGFSTSKALLVVSRLLSGVGASAALTISAGVLSDCWRSEQRGCSLRIYSWIPILGPAIGPVIGGCISELSTWRCSFWSTSIFDAFIQVVALCVLRESHAGTVLRRKTSRLQKATGLPIRSGCSDTNPAGPSLLQALRRPVYLLLSQTVLQLISILAGVSFGVLYVVLATLPTMFTSQYGQSSSKAALNYLSLGIGFAIGAQAFGTITDLLYRRQQARIDVRPELRVVFLLPATMLCATGLLCLGWSVHSRLHLIVPNISLAIFGLGSQLGTQSVNAYVIDVFGALDRSASAVAGVWAAKSLAGFGFPLFGPVIYKSLGWGWGSSVLAAVLLAVGVPVSVGLCWSGERFRKNDERKLTV